ncbi:malto-oligosyltrehalose synthase [Caulobacter endophyticus]|uniref:Malto-oligosyltrehalose synthase n=1 Tax=Caulobacter endophyticus TaxID=2172652 RepID=A0A2T9JGW1_9CAUL|nr:malto-oligosyltrehalose synthase [Caulobacter endophyticus]PVM82940.1 malto-oligosyltrehalose synthase [Caulobacter endophyticus]
MKPSATYRVQFHAGFTFADASGLAPFWAKLGVSHVYASPIATARAGSMHGYDVVDPSTINPALGGEDGFRAMVAALRAECLGVVLDIVPNHLAVGGGDNAWWLDVLENGRASPFARMFDIDWAPADPELTGKLLAPFLGAPYAEALSCGAIRLGVEPGRISVLAHDTHRFPLRRCDYAEVLSTAGVSRIEDLVPTRLAAYDPQTTEGRARLHDLLERQHYRLAWWRTAGDAINWRRFFDITELAGLRIEDPAVFEAVHALPFRLYREGLIDGLRVDHVDGLADPPAYCRRLREALRSADPGRTPWLVVEKILGADEALASNWGVDGTTGYEVMNEISALQHDPKGAAPLAALWQEISGRSADFEAEEHMARREILAGGFAGQLDAAAIAFHRLARSDIATRDLPLPALRRALAALVEAFRTYRTYAADTQLAPAEALARAKASQPASAPALDQIAAWLSGQGEVPADLRADAIRRLEQLSAPVAAKAVEDTAFYRYGRLLSRNDVGFDPGRFSTSPERFLQRAAERGEAFPSSLLATATHDHKRGEDVRARLAVLSEIPDLWSERAKAWLSLAPLEGVDPGDAHMLHQMIVGAWPLDLRPDDAKAMAAFADRLAGWQRKALREAKLRTSWTVQDEAYEAACETYLQRLLTEDEGEFRQNAHAFVDRIAPAGVANSLVQTGLKLTLPGAPDLYQGTEFWDFSLVDPDNRRPVDYDQRRSALEQNGEQDWRDGATKQALIHDLLTARREHPDLFTASLAPLQIEGARAESAIGFERAAGDRRLLVVAAIRCAETCILGRAPKADATWWADAALPDGRSLSRLTGGSPFWWTIE